jgi:uncharacterized phage protein (TIGR01671 family)
MREISFKAKRRDTEKWVEGYYMCLHGINGAENSHFIIDNHGEYNLIDPDTLCQYTGLTDKNGTKIFENDIVNYDYTSHKVVFENRFGSACFGIVINDRNKVLNFCSLVPTDKMVVIGNIFDNPELIGGVEG